LGAHIFRRLEQVARAVEVAGGPGVIQIAAQVADELLAERKIARREQHELTVGGGFEFVHLAVHRGVIHPGAGAAVGGQHQSLFDADAKTVGHGQILRML